MKLLSRSHLCDSYVYYLVLNKKINYIGVTSNVTERIEEHIKNGKYFTHCYAVPMKSRNSAYARERYHIEYVCPFYNERHNRSDDYEYFTFQLLEILEARGHVPSTYKARLDHQKVVDDVLTERNKTILYDTIHHDGAKSVKVTMSHAMLRNKEEYERMQERVCKLDAVEPYVQDIVDRIDRLKKDTHIK